MNQILLGTNVLNNYNNKHTKNKPRKFLIFHFIFCLIMFLLVTIYYIYSSYENNEKENISKKILDNYSITKLYSNNTNYSSIETSSNMYVADGTSFSIIGLIEIKSIQINYPIISSYNDDLLKIAPCRFMGPMPNEVGNLCIAGHNYNSYKFFSKIKNLSNGDIISIYDLSGNKVNYSVYSSYETDYNNLSCTSQNTNGKKEVTLITCNNIKNKRRVVKAIET